VTGLAAIYTGLAAAELTAIPVVMTIAEVIVRAIAFATKEVASAVISKVNTALEEALSYMPSDPTKANPAAHGKLYGVLDGICKETDAMVPREPTSSA